MRHTALVTGGGRGLGRAIVTALAPEGAVAALDLAFPEGPGAAALAIEADVRDSRAVQAAVDRVVVELGGLDWVVCAAGIVRDRVHWKLTDQDWEDVLDVNLGGSFKVVRAAAPHLRRSRQGRVVLLSSINGLRGVFGQTNYSASKAGVIGLGRSLAQELARDRVTVNVIAPGFIDTPMTAALAAETRERAIARTPLGRFGRTEEIGEAVRFFCSAGAGYITGAVLPVDGGQLAAGGAGL